MRPQPQYPQGPRTAVLGPFDAARARARGIAAVVAVLSVVMTFGVAGAHATPTVTAECTPGDCSGWYRSEVSIAWRVDPSTAVIEAGCQPKTFTTDTPGTTEFCRARDGSGRVTVEQEIKVDMTSPVVTGGAPARGADANGWYNHAVPVTFHG